MPDYQQAERIALNKGVNLRDVPEALEDGQWRRITNGRSYSEGSISTRPGRRWVAGEASGEDVTVIAKLGTQIIHASGNSVFHNNTAYPTVFNGTQPGLVVFKASDADERWVYVTDGSEFRMLGEDGSDIKWGITAPTRSVIPTVLSDTGLLDSSAPGAVVYNWRAVFKNSRTGGKSNASPVHSGVAASLKKVKLVADSSLDGQVDTVEFYRQGGLNGADTWRLVGSTANKGLDPATNAPIPVEFIDNLSDADAVKGFELRLDNDVPFTTKTSGGSAVYEAVFQYIWGPFNGTHILAAGDPNRPGDVYWTNPGRPHSAAPTNHVTVSAPDDPVVGGFIHGGTPYVWTTKDLYALQFDGTSFTPRKTFCGRGLSLPGAFAVGPWIWFLSHDGVYYTDGESPAEPFTELALRPLFMPQVEDRTYVAPGALASVAWPPFDLNNNPGKSSLDAANASIQRNFTIAATPTSVSLAAGGTATVTVTITANDVFYHDIALSVVGELPPGVSYAFEPPAGQPGAGIFTSTLTLTANDSIAAASVNFQIKGQRVGGALNHLTGQIGLTTTAGTPPSTGSFNLSFNPSSIALARTTQGQVQLVVEPINGFAEAVEFTITTPPTGFTVSPTQNSATPPSLPVGVTIDVNSLAALGSQTVTITGTSGSVSATANLNVLVLGEPGEPPPTERITPVVRLAYGGQELHIHYKDRLGQWVHLRCQLPYSRWCNDESPEIAGYGSVYETCSYYDDSQAQTALLIGTNQGMVALETGTYDYIPGNKIQVRIRDRSDTFGGPRTLKELGNIIVEADCGDAVLPLALNAAQPSGIAVVPFINSETTQLGYQRIAGTGRQKFPRALRDSNNQQPVYAYSLGLDFEWNGNATLYGWLTQYHPDEEYITNWAFGPTSHGVRGWKQIRDVYIAIWNPFSAVTPTVEIDGVVYPLYTNSGGTTIPISARKQKVHLWLPAVKGMLYRWNLSGSQFRLYGNECEIRIKEIASGLGYQLTSAFQGGTAEV